VTKTTIEGVNPASANGALLAKCGGAISLGLQNPKRKLTPEYPRSTNRKQIRLSWNLKLEYLPGSVCAVELRPWSQSQGHIC
jgi:hypothetical protein